MLGESVLAQDVVGRGGVGSGFDVVGEASVNPGEEPPDNPAGLGLGAAQYLGIIMMFALGSETDRIAGRCGNRFLSTFAAVAAALAP